MNMTLTDEIKGNLGVYGMSETDIEECVPYVIQKLNQEGSVFSQYTPPDIWQRQVLDIDEFEIMSIFKCHVLPEVVRWLCARYDAQKVTLQEIHRLSSPLNEQGKAE